MRNKVLRNFNLRTLIYSFVSQSLLVAFEFQIRLKTPHPPETLNHTKGAFEITHIVRLLLYKLHGSYLFHYYMGHVSTQINRK